MAFCVLIGAKTRGRGRGESAQVMLGRENNLYLLSIHLFMKGILLYGGDDHSISLVSVLLTVTKREILLERK